MALKLDSNGNLVVTPETSTNGDLLQEWGEKIKAMPPKNPPSGIWTSAGYVNPATGENYSQGTGPIPAENELAGLYPDGNPNTGRWTPYGWNPNAPAVTSEEAARLNDPVADQVRNRKSEADRMMQQYASDEYWDTEAGKAMMELGNQERYTGDDLAGFYDAQQAVGTGGIDEIIDAMGYTGNMETWAKANPALALREYQKNSEALPADGYAGYGTGEPQVDERLKDVTNQFLQQRVDQLKDREDGPLWGPESPQYPDREDGPLWGPGDPPPVVQTQEQAPSLPGFQLPGQADGLSELLQSLGTREVLDQIDETGGGLAEKAGEWYGRKKAQEVPGANLPFIGDWIQDEGARRGGAKGREYWDQYTGPFLQQN